MIKHADWIKDREPSQLQATLKTNCVDFISFALGLPSQDLFPVKQLMLSSRKNFNNLSFQYAPQSILLKKQILKLMEQRGVSCKEDQIFITSGAQQGISILCKLLLNDKDSIIVEELAYPGFLQAIELYTPRISVVNTDFQEGIEISHLREILKKNKRSVFLYIISSGHNPLGISLNLKKRIELANIASEYQLPIIEDDAYGFISYASPLPPLRAFNNEQVLYVGSFSKIIAPSLRTGWLVVPEYLITKLSIIKESMDIDTQTIGQGMVSSFISEGHLDNHIEKIRATYLSKRDYLSRCLQRYLPEDISYHIPDSGFFIWAKLHHEIDTQDLLKYALKNKLSFVPGSSFSPVKNKKYKLYLRLNFSFPDIPQIKEGVMRLKNTLDQIKRLK